MAKVMCLLRFPDRADVSWSEIIKQPLQTSISLETSDFDLFTVEDDHCVGITIKDFRSIITHADTLRATVTAMYSDQGLPMQFSYSSEGVRCEVTVQTLPSGRGSSASVSRAVTREPQQRTATRTTPVTGNQSNGVSHNASKGRPRTSQLGQLGRRHPSQQAPAQTTADPDPESLFVPLDTEDDALWQPVEEREAETERDVLGWDASDEHVRAVVASTPPKVADKSSRLGTLARFVIELLVLLPPTSPCLRMAFCRPNALRNSAACLTEVFSHCLLSSRSSWRNQLQ